jgi:hypothetical protein
MCAVPKPASWKFSDSSMRVTYESMISSRNIDSLVMQAQDQFENRSTEPIAKLVGQSFANAFSEELHFRSLVAARMLMRTFTSTEQLASSRHRTRVVLDIIIDVVGATQNELIDALANAKRQCSAQVGLDVKILLKAELKSGTVEHQSSNGSQPRALSAQLKKTTLLSRN